MFVGIATVISGYAVQTMVFAWLLALTGLPLWATTVLTLVVLAFGSFVVAYAIGGDLSLGVIAAVVGVVAPGFAVLMLVKQEGPKEFGDWALLVS